MGAPYWSLEEKCEDALHSWLTGSVGGLTNVYLAGEDNRKKSRYLSIGCPDSEPAFDGQTTSGRRLVHAVIAISTRVGARAKTTTGRKEHRDHVASVLDQMYQTDRVAKMNAQGVTDLHIFTMELTRLERHAEGRMFVTRQELEIKCCPVDID